MKENTKKLYEKRAKLMPNAMGIMCPISAAKAKGSIVTDADGQEHIDFAGGIGALNIGHSPDVVVKAIQEQAEKFIHTSINVAIYDQYFDLAEKLTQLFPHGGSSNNTKVMLTSTGAESVENAVKIARQATKRQGVICYTQAFHGRSLMATTLTSKAPYKKGIGPLAPEVHRLPFPNYKPFESFMSIEDFCDMEIERLENFFKTNVIPENIACIILELVQGEGGFYVFPKPYIQRLRKICDKQGILLVFDEVQSGFGRTGKWSAYAHYDVVPDLSTWGKSLGSGVPIGCVLGRTDVIDSINKATIGGTYLGNPICASAALATIRHMEAIDINALGQKVGKTVRARMLEFQKKYPNIVGEVRGLGAMLAFDIIKNGDWDTPNPDLTKTITEACAQNGLIVITAGIHGSAIRTLSPLNIEDDILDKGLGILENIIQKHA